MEKKQGAAPVKATPISWTYQPLHGGAGFPWGPHKVPVKLEFEGISLAVEKSEGRMHYRRDSNNESFEKMLLAEKGRLFLSPVEPFHKPVGISTHLLVEIANRVYFQHCQLFQ